MRYLGIDYGTKKIGIAISDQSGTFAFPRDTIDNDKNAIETLVRIISLEEVMGIVVGDTRSIDGGANQITNESDTFVSRLQQSTQTLIHRSREAWSSQEAARFAPPGKRHDDSAAAAIILQRFLDSNKKTE
jgi:putative Holliday junction resolvase